MFVGIVDDNYEILRTRKIYVAKIIIQVFCNFYA